MFYFFVIGGVNSPFVTIEMGRAVVITGVEAVKKNERHHHHESPYGHGILQGVRRGRMGTRGDTYYIYTRA